MKRLPSEDKFEIVTYIDEVTLWLNLKGEVLELTLYKLWIKLKIDVTRGMASREIKKGERKLNHGTIYCFLPYIEGGYIPAIHTTL